ncbi:hypothetical protein WR25_11831 [Diploscapter pachys]|uniref:Uncharacterized protein n=1 Tax=Diploscapter pachys TaxID=2018661 RepID=A0A2A2KLB6_9BILA|nr:hypothetical protein WR25_11831 [Diploscapter pachys]
MSIFEDRCVIRARYGRTAAIAWQVAKGWSNITTTEIIWVRPKPFESLSELDYDVDALDAIDLERIEIRYTQDEHWLQVIGDAQNQDFVFLLEFPSHPSTQLVCSLLAVLTCLHSRVCVIVPYSFEDFLSLSIYTSNIYNVESMLNNDTRDFTEEQIIVGFFFFL